ncbi:hypothetical protein ACFU3E_37355 [Streptomyces sp. NPDC057424]|uniref:hypothetical protein n=1 Tax=Streptomyces sp. NPDC057424 TaxID=3346127 RepID=UPI0036C85E59
MVNNNPVRRLAAATVTVAALAAPLAACGNEENPGRPQTTEQSKAASASPTLCGVQLSTGARKALLHLVGSNEFESSGSQDSLGNTAKALVSGYGENGPDDYGKEYDLCTVYGSTASMGIDLSFHLPEGIPTSVSPKFKKYEVGELALSRPPKASLYMKCSSDAFGSDSGTVLIQGDLTNTQAPSRDDATVRKENLNVLYSVSLAMAKELGCEGDADLPGQFSLPQEA